MATVNVRGLGGAVKKRVIRTMVRKENLDFLCIQETKLELLDYHIRSSLWDGFDFDWIFQPSIGKSGGLLCIWKKDKFQMISYRSGKGFLGVVGYYLNSSDLCHIINVYSPCNYKEKREVWVELGRWKFESSVNLWCFVGDFNSVKCSDERKDSNLDWGPKSFRVLMLHLRTQTSLLLLSVNKSAWVKDIGLFGSFDLVDSSEFQDGIKRHIGDGTNTRFWLENVWQSIFNWLGISFALPLSPITHYSSFLGVAKNKKCWKTWSIIWLATMWALWLARNDVVFNNSKPTILQILNSVKVKSWLWTKAQHEKDHIPFQDWTSKPLDCILIDL
ncbi:hypothetical protein Lal_00012388 [Lupinus albus]|nr:hypothetical protein Lal_00012388 [Lupinus albus]